MKKNVWLLLIALFVFASCTTKEYNVKGTIKNSDDGLISIIQENGDTMFFESSDTVLPFGCEAEVIYLGEYKKGMKFKSITVLERLAGGDRDEHGCIGSAGYTWSEVLKDCIRVFEKGVRVESVDTDGSAFIVFSKDSTLVELFLSTGGKNDILERRALPGGGYAWNIEDDDTKNVKLENGLWTISQRSKVIYIQKDAE